MPADLPLTVEAPIPIEVLEQAAAWFVHLRSGEATQADRQRWQDWCAASTEHRRAWQRAEALANRFDRLDDRTGAAGRVLDLAAPTPGRRRAARRLAVAAGALGLGWLVYRAPPPRQWLADQATTVGERRHCVLADGSRVDLDTDSAIDWRFDAERRWVRLRHGRMLIETAHDPRPLVVATDQGEIQALGTRFSVRQDAAASRVDLYEGLLEVRPLDGRPARLRAGESARFTQAQIDPIRPADDNGPTWLKGLMVADDLPLSELVAELDRYRRGHLGCAPAVAGLRISGVFRLDDTDAALSAIARTLPVRIQRVGPYWTRIDAR